MKISNRCVAGIVLLAAVAAAIPSQCFALAISTGSDTTAALGNIANSIVRISDPGGSGTGTIISLGDYNGGKHLGVLTADHVVRDPGGGGSTLYAPNQITVSFGNSGGGGASFAADAVATQFDLPNDGSSAVDLALLCVFIPGSQLNTLPAVLNAVNLPGAAPAANAAITQAGYGRQGSVATVSGNLAYVYSPANALGAPYGTLKAGPNTVNANGVTNITGAVSDFAGQNYVYDGFQNGCLINGVSPNYNGSTSYIFSGDSGGPSLSGNTIFGVHSSSVTGTISGDPASEFAYSANANYLWQDVSVFSSLGWVNTTLAEICPVPEPSTWILLAFGSVVLILWRRRAS
jgi:hypothetical protein